jgi:hypothetical protein
MKIRMIPLTSLVPSPANVRKTGTANGIAELAASIEAHGLLQNLQVEKAANGKFEVVAGGRRLAALKVLAKRKALAKDAPVACNVLDDEAAAEISLAENEMRQAAAVTVSCSAPHQVLQETVPRPGEPLNVWVSFLWRDAVGCCSRDPSIAHFIIDGQNVFFQKSMLQKYADLSSTEQRAIVFNGQTETNQEKCANNIKTALASAGSSNCA